MSQELEVFSRARSETRKMGGSEPPSETTALRFLHGEGNKAAASHRQVWTGFSDPDGGPLHGHNPTPTTVRPTGQPSYLFTLEDVCSLNPAYTWHCH